MIFVFYALTAFSVFLGWKSLRGGVLYLEFFKREIGKPESNYAPFVSIIAPCRGLDQDLETNLNALFNQNFPRYEIVFVVADADDESVSVIKKVSRQNDEAKLVAAGRAENESQKIHNLRRALLEVSERSEVFVFVDSDARPGENWLRDLVAPLADETVGAATGYRWFVSRRGNFASELRSVWNASIASALGATERNNFCWGGSTAITRARFEQLDIREKWRGALSDDYAFTRVMQENDLPIRFVPQCLTATVEDCNFRQMLEFTTRQMKITRVYAPRLWMASLLGSIIFTLTFWSGVFILFFTFGWRFWLALALLTVIFALGTAKAVVRLNAVKLVLKSYARQLDRSFLYQTTLWTITPILFVYNDFAALLSNRITWRGIEYELKSPRETVIISRDE